MDKNRFALMKTLLTIICTFYTLSSFGQNYNLSDKSEGTIFKNSQDSINGDIVLGSEWNSIFFIQNHSMKQMSPEEFSSFKIKLDNHNNHYLSLPIKSEGPHLIFKLLTDGKYQLLYHKTSDSSKDGYYWNDDGVARKLDVDNCFAVFGNMKKVMRFYAFSHALDVSIELDLTQVFSYFNRYYSDME